MLPLIAYSREDSFSLNFNYNVRPTHRRIKYPPNSCARHPIKNNYYGPQYYFSESNKRSLSFRPRRYANESVAEDILPFEREEVNNNNNNKFPGNTGIEDAFLSVLSSSGCHISNQHILTRPMLQLRTRNYSSHLICAILKRQQKSLSNILNLPSNPIQMIESHQEILFNCNDSIHPAISTTEIQHENPFFGISASAQPKTVVTRMVENNLNAYQINGCERSQHNFSSSCLSFTLVFRKKHLTIHTKLKQISQQRVSSSCTLQQLEDDNIDNDENPLPVFLPDINWMLEIQHPPSPAKFTLSSSDSSNHNFIADGGVRDVLREKTRGSIINYTLSVSNLLNTGRSLAISPLLSLENSEIVNRFPRMMDRLLDFNSPCEYIPFLYSYTSSNCHRIGDMMDHLARLNDSWRRFQPICIHDRRCRSTKRIRFADSTISSSLEKITSDKHTTGVEQLNPDCKSSRKFTLTALHGVQWHHFFKPRPNNEKLVEASSTPIPAVIQTQIETVSEKESEEPPVRQDNTETNAPCLITPPPLQKSAGEIAPVNCTANRDSDRIMHYTESEPLRNDTASIQMDHVDRNMVGNIPEVPLVPPFQFNEEGLQCIMESYFRLHRDHGKDHPLLTPEKAIQRDVPNSTLSIVKPTTEASKDSQCEDIIAETNSFWKKGNILKVLVSDIFIESKPRTCAELYHRWGIECIDCPLQKPVHMIVDSITCICMVDEDISTLSTGSHDQKRKEELRNLLKSLTEIVFKFQNTWLLISSSVEYFTELSLLLCQQLSRFPNKVVLRHCSTEDKLQAKMIAHICERSLQGALLSCRSGSPSLYTYRPWADRLQGEEEQQQAVFIAHCEFLQGMPSMNFFLAAILLNNWSLRQLMFIDYSTILHKLDIDQHEENSERVNTKSMVKSTLDLIRCHFGLAIRRPRAGL